MKVMNFDIECANLAQHFLQDYADVTSEDIDGLALELQQTVEDWFLMRPDLHEKQ